MLQIDSFLNITSSTQTNEKLLLMANLTLNLKYLFNLWGHLALCSEHEPVVVVTDRGRLIWYDVICWDFLWEPLLSSIIPILNH